MFPSGLRIFLSDFHLSFFHVFSLYSLIAHLLLILTDALLSGFFHLLTERHLSLLSMESVNLTAARIHAYAEM